VGDVRDRLLTDPEDCATCHRRRPIMIAMDGPRGATWWLCSVCYRG
jgi:hypothetical protein